MVTLKNVGCQSGCTFLFNFKMNSESYFSINIYEKMRKLVFVKIKNLQHSKIY